MNAEQRLDRDLPLILGNLAAGPYPDYVDDVLVTTARRRQRPAWTFPERWLPLGIATGPVPISAFPWRQGAIAIAAALLILAALAVYVGSQPRLPAPIGVAENGLVAFQRGDEIILHDPRTGEDRVLAAETKGWIDPWFSPDGRQILLAREPSSTTGELGVVPVDGGEIRVITPEPLTRNTWAEWSPNGDAIALISTMAVPSGGTASLEPRVSVIDIASGIMTTFEAVSKPTAVMFAPPDGEQIIVASETPDGGRAVSRIDRDGADLTTLVETAPGTLLMGRQAVSPDGRLLVYSVWDQAVRHGVMRVLDLQSGEDRTIGDAPEVLYYSGPIIAPDGSRVLTEQVMSVDGVDVPRLAVVDVETGAVTLADLLTPHGASYEWSPDGTRILASARDSEKRPQPHVLIDPTTGSVTPAPWDATSYPAWQRVAP